MNENTMLVQQMGINTEQATANCEELAKAIREITAGVSDHGKQFLQMDPAGGGGGGSTAGNGNGAALGVG